MVGNCAKRAGFALDPDATVVGAVEPGAVSIRVGFAERALASLGASAEVARRSVAL